MKTNFELGKISLTGKDEELDLNINIENVKVSTEYSAQELIEILKHDLTAIEKIINLVKPLVNKIVSEQK